MSRRARRGLNGQARPKSVSLMERREEEEEEEEGVGPSSY